MRTEELTEVLGWLKTTDLSEVSFRQGGKGFSLTAAGAGEPAPPAPAGRYTAVNAPAIGLFQWSRLGQARKAEEGVSVAAGETLGQVETKPGKSVPVTAPQAGRVARVFVEGGAAVEYGQPILFLES